MTVRDWSPNRTISGPVFLCDRCANLFRPNTHQQTCCTNCRSYDPLAAQLLNPLTVLAAGRQAHHRKAHA